MVCHRCKIMVKEILERHDAKVVHISLGEISLASLPSKKNLKSISADLEKLGFELMNDQTSRQIEKIKTFVINSIHYDAEPSATKFSVLLAQDSKRDYSYLSKLFSSVEGITIEQFIIQQKIEKVKEYIMYNELSLSQIALNMGYSSTAHLSAQFKKVTGISPSVFKKDSGERRKSLDEVGIVKV